MSEFDSMNDVVEHLVERVMTHSKMGTNTLSQLQEMQKTLRHLSEPDDEFGSIINSMHDSVLLEQGITKKELAIYHRVEGLRRGNKKVIDIARKIRRDMWEEMVSPDRYKHFWEIADRFADRIKSYNEDQRELIEELETLGESGELPDGLKGFRKCIEDEDYAQKCVMFDILQHTLTRRLAIPSVDPVREKWCGDWTIPDYYLSRYLTVRNFINHLRKGQTTGEKVVRGKYEINMKELVEFADRFDSIDNLRHKIEELPSVPPVPELPKPVDKKTSKAKKKKKSSKDKKKISRSKTKKKGEKNAQTTK